MAAPRPSSAGRLGASVSLSCIKWSWATLGVAAEAAEYGPCRVASKDQVAAACHLDGILARLIESLGIPGAHSKAVTP